MAKVKIELNRNAWNIWKVESPVFDLGYNLKVRNQYFI